MGGLGQQATAQAFANFSSQGPCSHLQQSLDDEISKEALVSKSRPFCHLPRPCGFRNKLVEKDFMERVQGECHGNAHDALRN